MTKTNRHYKPTYLSKNGIKLNKPWSGKYYYIINPNTTEKIAATTNPLENPYTPLP